MGSCCVVCIPVGNGERTSLFECDRTSCTSRADYKTSCNHHVCYQDLVRMEKGSVPEHLKWQCLKQNCKRVIDPDRLIVNATGQERTYTQITSRVKAENRKWVVAGASIVLIFIGGLSFILSQE